jgi:hypothetical protein
VGAIDPLSTTSRRHQFTAVPTIASTARLAPTTSRAPAARCSRDRRYPAPLAIREVTVDGTAGLRWLDRGIAEPMEGPGAVGAATTTAGFCPDISSLSGGASDFMTFQPLEAR